PQRAELAPRARSRRACERGLARFAVGGRLEPALQMAKRDIGEGRDPGGVLVEARNEMQLPASGAEVRRLALDTDLLERLEAIGNESGTNDVHPANALLRKGEERLPRVRLEPTRAAETRLEAHAV